MPVTLTSTTGSPRFRKALVNCAARFYNLRCGMSRWHAYDALLQVDHDQGNILVKLCNRHKWLFR